MALFTYYFSICLFVICLVGTVMFVGRSTDSFCEEKTALESWGKIVPALLAMATFLVVSQQAMINREQHEQSRRENHPMLISKIDLSDVGDVTFRFALKNAGKAVGNLTGVRFVVGKVQDAGLIQPSHKYSYVFNPDNLLNQSIVYLLAPGDEFNSYFQVRDPEDKAYIDRRQPIKIMYEVDYSDVTFFPPRHFIFHYRFLIQWNGKFWDVTPLLQFNANAPEKQVINKDEVVNEMLNRKHILTDSPSGRL